MNTSLFGLKVVVCLLSKLVFVNKESKEICVSSMLFNFFINYMYSHTNQKKKWDFASKGDD